METKITELNDQNFESFIQSSKPVLVDFWADWCGPCHMITPVLQQIAVEKADTVTIAKLNVDANPDITASYRVRALPTLMLFKNGVIVDQVKGALPKAAIEKWISEALREKELAQ